MKPGTRPKIGSTYQGVIYPGLADITDIFSSPTVAELAGEIRRKARSQDAAPVESKASEGSHSAEQIEQLLDSLGSGKSVDDILGALN